MATQEAKEKIAPGNSVIDDLNEVEVAASRSADLTRQLLAFARKQVIAPTAVCLNDVVEDLLKMLGRLLGENLKLEWETYPDLWLVHVDPTQIDQVLANLCVNARDAISDVGTVRIELSNQTYDAQDRLVVPTLVPGEWVQIRFSDTGCGMSPDTVAHIFEPFFTTKPEGKGTGLGLATIYGIVSQNNGFIQVASELGRGTTFTICFPRYREVANQTKVVERLPIPASGGETVLIVEDEHVLLRLTSSLLQRLGYKTLAASSPFEALRFAREYEGDIHLLLTDMVMPEMNGRALAQKITLLRPGLKALFMSGYAADVVDGHAERHNHLHLLSKPFSMEDLSEKVRAVLDQAAVAN